MVGYRIIQILQNKSASNYFILAVVSLAIGILATNAILFALFPNIPVYNDAQLSKVYDEYVNEKTPQLAKMFPDIFVNNLRAFWAITAFPFVALLIFFVLERYGSDIRRIDSMTLVFKAPLILLMIILGFQTFDGLYIYFSAFPIAVALISYLTHGIIEIPAMIISGIFGFKVADVIIENLQSTLGKPIFEQLREVFKGWKHYLTFLFVIFVLVLVAALIESYITPIVVKVAFENYLGIQGVQI